MLVQKLTSSLWQRHCLTVRHNVNLTPQSALRHNRQCWFLYNRQRVPATNCTGYNWCQIKYMVIYCLFSSIRNNPSAYNKHFLRCHTDTVFMCRASSSILCCHERPVSCYFFVMSNRYNMTVLPHMPSHRSSIMPIYDFSPQLRRVSRSFAL